jgi:hypothetical protein
VILPLSPGEADAEVLACVTRYCVNPAALSVAVGLAPSGPVVEKFTAVPDVIAVTALISVKPAVADCDGVA